MSNTTAAALLAFSTILACAADCRAEASVARDCQDHQAYIVESEDVAYLLNYTVCQDESNVAPHAGMTVICLADGWTLWSHPSNAEVIVETTSLCGR